MGRTSLIMAVTVTLMLVTATPTTATTTDAASEAEAAEVQVTDSLDMRYIRGVTKDLTKIGSVESGFRVVGTPQDLETAQYLADQMMKLGLETLRSRRSSLTAGSLRARRWTYSHQGYPSRSTLHRLAASKGPDLTA